MAEEKVIWHEGMQLLPQHFQQQDRYYEENLYAYTRITRKNFYGIIEVEIDEALLARGKIVIKKFVAIFPDGTYVNIPDKDPVPEIFSVIENCHDQLIYLGIKERIPNYPESSEGNDYPATKYLIKEKIAHDSHKMVSLASQKAVMLVASVQSKIMESSREGDYCLLPFLKVKAISIDGCVTWDKEYIPPCFNVYISSFVKSSLFALNHEIALLVKKVDEHLHSRKISILDEVANTHLLILLYEYEAFFYSQNNLSYLAAEELYAHLLIFLKKLAFLRYKNRLEMADYRYDHYDLQNTLGSVMREIRKNIKDPINSLTYPLEINSFEKNIFITKIPEDVCANDASIVFAIAATISAENLIRYIKIAPPAEIKNLIFRSLPGVKLIPVKNIPREIPYQKECEYFTLDKREDGYASLLQVKKICIYWPENIGETQINIWVNKSYQYNEMVA